MLSATFLLTNEIEKRLMGEPCDFEIRVEDQAFEVHRLVLDANSEYYRAMFNSDMLEAQQQYCNESDISASAAKICIDCMYTSRLELNEDTVVEVLVAAHKWRLHDAVERCEEYLMDKLCLESCVEMMNLSQFYDLKKLRGVCRQCILNHLKMASKLEDLGRLAEVDIFWLLEASASIEVLPWHLWNVCASWEEKSPENSLCNVVPKFPFGMFSISLFKLHIWDNRHMSSCESCKKSAADLFLQNLSSRDLIFKVARDSLFMKKVAKMFGYSCLEKRADECILRNHRYVFTHRDILELEKDDLLKYVEQIDDECSDEQVSVIIEWLRSSDDRHDAFKRLFQYAENPSNTKISKFIQSLCNNLAIPLCSEVDGASDICGGQNYGGSSISDLRAFLSTKQKLSWWPKDSLFLKSLAKKFGFTNTEAKIDERIIYDFAKVSALQDFKRLDITDLSKFLSTPELYSASEEVIWNSVEVWVNYNTDTRSKHLNDIFDAMFLSKVSTEFLRDRVIKSPLVKNSKFSLEKIMTIILQRS